MKTKDGGIEEMIITKEMLEKCEVKEKESGVSITWEDTGDNYYEDIEFICWNGKK